MTLSTAAQKRMVASYQVVQRTLARQHKVYGVNTGFGKLADQLIPASDIRQLQVNLVRSHAAGVGDPLSREETRGMLFLRANVLAQGYSGVRPLLVDYLLTLLNKDVLPVIPAKGSVGASGDLAPLAHLALVLIGEGEVFMGTTRQPGAAGLARVGLKPIQLEAKEGISLLNGTQAMLSLGLLSLRRCAALLDTADVAGALSLEALKGTPVAFDAKVQQLRPYRGQAQSASNLRRLLAGSEIRVSHLNCRKVQDAYSLRCMPQVHGAVRDVLDYARGILTTEVNSVTDNPIVFPSTGQVINSLETAR